MTEKDGKTVASSFKYIARSGKTNHFISFSVEMVYRNNFSKKNILGEREVLVSDLLTPRMPL
jgi:hypothetical protein